MRWNDFSLPAIGERHDNDDGTSRQEELALCEPGEDIRLFREPEKPHDRMAVAVLNCRRVRYTRIEQPSGEPTLAAKGYLSFR